MTLLHTSRDFAVETGRVLAGGNRESTALRETLSPRASHDNLKKSVHVTEKVKTIASIETNRVDTVPEDGAVKSKPSIGYTVYCYVHHAKVSALKG